MLYHRAAAAYRKVNMETSPARILLALYDRLLRDLDEAEAAIEARQIAKKGEAVGHAIRILAELNAALDPSQNPELCERLAGLYGFAEERLLTASMKLEVEPIREARNVIADVKDGFAQVVGA